MIARLASELASERARMSRPHESQPVRVGFLHLDIQLGSGSFVPNGNSERRKEIIQIPVSPALVVDERAPPRRDCSVFVCALSARGSNSLAQAAPIHQERQSREQSIWRVARLSRSSAALD